ncbi:unnamed protein product [Lactuca virosa]|uniref:Uncharacterized protein n=1 Tax=Lactuca virosa TaxID=75947 RepID=A0AAU9M8C3_9ASTR|nr:unnamed protein product [Lactuca virosa]
MWQRFHSKGQISNNICYSRPHKFYILSCGLRIRFFSSIKKRKLGFCSFNSSQFATSLDWFELTVLHLLDTGS